MLLRLARLSTSSVVYGAQISFRQLSGRKGESKRDCLGAYLKARHRSASCPGALCCLPKAKFAPPPQLICDSCHCHTVLLPGHRRGHFQHSGFLPALFGHKFQGENCTKTCGWVRKMSGGPGRGEARNSGPLYFIPPPPSAPPPKLWSP